MLTKCIAADQRDWDQKLPLLMLAYRSSEHDSTGYSPSQMMLGREVELPVDLLYGPPPESRLDKCQYVMDILKTSISWHVKRCSKQVTDKNAHMTTELNSIHTLTVTWYGCRRCENGLFLQNYSTVGRVPIG